MTRPSWVSYSAQASLAGRTAHFVPGSGGVPDAGQLARTAAVAHVSGRPVRAVVVTLPDNPTGTMAPAGAVRALCAVAERHGLIIISDEIYRDLVHDNVADFTGPASIYPERTVVTTGLSKNLALGGWRLGVTRLPDGRLGRELRARLLGIGSEVWSAPAGPVQQAAALAFGEPAPLAERIALSRRLHARVAREVASRLASACASVPPPQAAFYVYPDFTPLANVLRGRHGITSDEGLTALLLRRTAWARCRAARSATIDAGCDCGWRPHCSTARRTSSGMPRWTRPTPARCPGSPRRWTGWRRSWPT